MSNHEEDSPPHSQEAQLGRKHPVIHSMKVPLATTFEELMQDFPFRGTLLFYNEDRGMHTFFKKVDNQLRLSEMEKSKFFKNGEYRLQTHSESGERVEIDFGIENKAQVETNLALLKEDEIAKITTETRNIVSSEYESRINGYKGELDDYARKWRDSVLELSTIKNQEFQQRQILTDSHYQKERELLSEISDLKQQLAIAQLEAQYNGNDEDFKSKLLAMAAEVAPNLLAAITGNQPIENPEQIAGEVDFEETTETELNDRPEMEQAQQPLTPELARSRFKKALLQQAFKTLKSANPEIEVFQQNLTGMVAQMEQIKVSVEAKDWINIVTGMSNFSLQNNIAPDRIATLIHPVVNQLTGSSAVVKTVFNSMDAKDLVPMLTKQFGVEAPEPLQNLLIEVFTHLKKIEA